VLLDPPPDDDAVGAHGRAPLPTNLTAELVKRAAKGMLILTADSKGILKEYT